MPTPVFLSVGRTSNAEQAAFVDAVLALLVDTGFEIRRATYSSVSPLKKVEEEMDVSAATVVIAFERIYSPSATELRGGESARPVVELKLPTVWNQIEAAMAYTRGHPLLVLCEEGLRDEGLLEARYDWYVQWLPLTSDALQTPMFRGVFRDWRDRAQTSSVALKSRRSKSEAATDTSRLTVASIIGAMTPAQAWGILGAVAAALAGYTAFLLMVAG